MLGLVIFYCTYSKCGSDTVGFPSEALRVYRGAGCDQFQFRPERFPRWNFLVRSAASLGADGAEPVGTRHLALFWRFSLIYLRTPAARQTGMNRGSGQIMPKS